LRQDFKDFNWQVLMSQIISTQQNGGQKEEPGARINGGQGAAEGW